MSQSNVRYAQLLMAMGLLLSTMALHTDTFVQANNLLSNPGFEDEGKWLFQDSIREVMVPPGWFAFWRSAPPEDLPLPSNCPRRTDIGCYWARPEFREVKASDFANRVHSGTRALRYFTYGRMHEAGVYQTIEQIPVGVQLRFSVWLQAWMCSDASACERGKRSDAPGRMHLQVGIDPEGGIDPWSPEIVWSSEGEAFDNWKLFEVEAFSESGLATVFVRSHAEWDWTRLNNDVYVDDAQLEIVKPALPSDPPLTVLRTQLLPHPTSPDLITHTVLPGETLASIVLAYGISMEEMSRLNRLLPGQSIYPGQVLVTKGTDYPEPPNELPSQLVMTTNAVPAATTGEQSITFWGPVLIGVLFIGILVLLLIRRT